MPTIRGNDGEEIHLVREEDPIDRMTTDNFIRANQLRREQRIKFALTALVIVGGITAFCVFSEYLTPKKPWPDWAIALVIVGGMLAAVAYGTRERR